MNLMITKHGPSLWAGSASLTALTVLVQLWGCPVNAQTAANPMEGAIEVRLMRTLTPQLMTVVAPVTGRGVTGGGLVADDAGNIYLSDVGVLPDTGGIILIPKDGRTPIRLVRGMHHPTDVELSPDHRALIIAGPEGVIYRYYLGVSVRVNFADTPRDPIVFLKTDKGTFASRQSTDGYFHFRRVLEPPQESTQVHIYVEDQHVGVMFVRNLQTRNGKPAGHTVIDLTMPGSNP